MSKPTQAINRYKADLREMFFLLFEQLKLGDLLGKNPYQAWGEEEVRGALSECYRWAKEVTGPLNSVGDREGCTLREGRVITPKGFKEAWKSLYEAGWPNIAVKQSYGGASAPSSVYVLIQELLSGANVAFNMYPSLTYGAAEVIEIFGTDEQRKTYVERMVQGFWGGTMCLTEAEAGSDVGAAKTVATRNSDGSYSIKGTKIFISAGDSDLPFGDNTIHLVLARVAGAPAGTKGLTLFIVPRMRFDGEGNQVESNDVEVISLEHKMGIHGSATCTINFGDRGQCIGYALGGESELNRGMHQMFRMMNGARIAVGIQGVSVASSAFLNALHYAKERKQGANITHWKDATAPRVPIVEHADVRRMLLDMKSKVEGIRALAVKLAHHQDLVAVCNENNEAQAKSAYHQGQVDLLVPLVKAYGSDQAFRICETAIQTFGGAGFTSDYPVEQYCRDAKIFSVYEGTNHIQAMDLVSRKLGQDGGANFQAFLSDVSTFVSNHISHPTLAEDVKHLSEAHEAVAGSAMRLLMWFQSGQVPMVPLAANRFLEMMSELAVGYVLLEGAVIAEQARLAISQDHPDFHFYSGKISGAHYFCRNILPGAVAKAKWIALEDRSPLEIRTEAFATI